jgi:hypothetical protein
MTIQRKSTRHITEYLYALIDETTGHVKQAKIVFEDGKFLKCEFPFTGIWSREQWAALAEIESEIHRIEEGMK